MCGIFGVSNGHHVAAQLLAGLGALEYRGYDSAGVATTHGGRIALRRAEGKLANLARLVEQHPLPGSTGIAHTRWATHGVPSEINAHPHATARVAVVHNGIIENYRELRRELDAAGHTCRSATDSEVIPLLLDDYLARGLEPMAALRATLDRLRGTFALGILLAGDDRRIYAARRGSPLAIGIGRGTSFLASDAPAISAEVRHVLYLEDGDCAVLERDEVLVLDQTGATVSRPAHPPARTLYAVGKGTYPHHMLKEIHEQPQAIARTLAALRSPEGELAHLDLPWATCERLTIVACGTSFYAGMVARYWLASLAALPCDLEIASEFRYAGLPLAADGAALFISQSGETADTLAGLRLARQQGQRTVAVVNVPASTIAREAQRVLHTHAGPEIGVASTKTFTTQLLVLAAIAVEAAAARGRLSAQEYRRAHDTLSTLPALLEATLEQAPTLRRLAARLAEARDVLFLGRGLCYPIALEAALKLKEISYIHADGYAAGEMKHGPIALVDARVPVVVLAPSDALFDKSVSNLREVAARGAPILLLSDAEGVRQLTDEVAEAAALPAAPPLLLPFVYAVAVQLLAYYAAVHKGTDIDQPRNLAKSVTVE